MAGRNVPLVVLPRFSTFVGNGLYWTQPIPVAAYDAITINAWRGLMNGAGPPSTSLQFQESNDLSAWSATLGTSGGVLPPSVETQYRPLLSKAWFRMGIVLAGTDPGVTCYAVGFAELRER
jgi:hypothetical protein